MPDTRPRIVFTDGVCNACLWAGAKRTIDWQERRTEFQELLDKIDRSGPYDCIVPFSGGKDSAYIAWRLKFEFGLHPLLVTYGQLLWTEAGRHNLEQICRLGFDIHYWRADQRVSRVLARRFMLERGHPKLHYDSAVNAVPLITAVKFNIPLVIYAEHGESEYGGLVLSERSRAERDLAEVLENQVGDDARNWEGDGVSARDLYPYIYPDLDDIARVEIKAIYFSHFFRWASPLNAAFIASKVDWRAAEGGRSEGTFTNFDSIDDKIDGIDYWMMLLKYNFGRCVRDANRHLQNGLITRDEAIRLCRLYDHEFPRRYFGDCLEYMNLTEREFFEAAERHRSPDWEKRGDEWVLKDPL